MVRKNNFISKTRLWCFTQFDKMDWDYASMIGRKVKYIAYGLEKCPKTGRPHHQGFIYFRTQQRSIKNIAKSLGKCHVEPCQGSLCDNDYYCSKAGQLVEFGEKPAQGTRMDINDVMDAVKAGATELDLAEANPGLWCQYGRRFERYRDLLQPP